MSGSPSPEGLLELAARCEAAWSLGPYGTLALYRDCCKALGLSLVGCDYSASDYAAALRARAQVQP